MWGFFALILFATNSPGEVMFFWSLTILVEPLIYLMGVHFTYSFLYNQKLTFGKLFLSIIPILPVIFLLSTKFNLLGVDLNDCTAIEGPIALYYSYAVEIIYSVVILFLVINRYKKSEELDKRKFLYFGLGIFLFLITFSSGNIIGSFTDDWVLSQVGYFGMPIFIGVLAYLVVRYNSFNVKLIATQVLVWGLAILIGSQFFFIKTPTNMVLNGFTFFASIVLGYFLIKSVKKEVQQKEELARLNINLQELLKQRESLVHLVTHKVKGSFTRSKYIFAGILDGTFGDINAEVKMRAQQGLDSDNMGIETVDLVLNAANLEKGTVKYDMKVIDFAELVKSTISEKKLSIESKGLKLETEIEDGVYNVLGDSLWLKEVSNNLVENALKYTREGKITVGLERRDKKILFYVKDTGVGVTEDDKKNLFTEGGRGKESVKINVDSTGYGLYSVRLIVDAHKGKVWMEPNKEANGSVFFVELDAV
jgi:signal transduction histidine kinase